MRYPGAIWEDPETDFEVNKSLDSMAFSIRCEALAIRALWKGVSVEGKAFRLKGTFIFPKGVRLTRRGICEMVLPCWNH